MVWPAASSALTMALTKHPARAWPLVYQALADVQQQLLKGTPQEAEHDSKEPSSGPMQPLAALRAAVDGDGDRGATDPATRLKTLLSVCLATAT